MGVVDSLKKVYFKIEDQYYAFCDGVEKTPVKIYEWFVNPIENRGMPSFPFFVLLILLLFGGIAFVFLNGGTLFQQTNTLKITLSSDGQPVSGVNARLTVDGVDSSFTARSNNAGVLEFNGVPAGKKATLVITDSRFESFSQVITTSSTSLSFELVSSASKTFNVIVTNQDNDPLSGASVSFQDANGRTVRLVTDSRGRVLVSYSSGNDVFSFSASKTGFEKGLVSCTPSDSSCVISLTHSGGVNPPVAKGGVRVTVEDENGKAIEGRVAVYNSVSDAVVSEHNLEYGEAFFEEVVEAGTQVYVNVYPTDNSFATYYGGVAGDVETVSASKSADFSIVLKKKKDVLPKIDFTKMDVTFKDKDGAAIENAVLSLYATGTTASSLAAIGEEKTDVNGNAVFDVEVGRPYYLTVFADGFLPFVQKSIVGGKNSFTLTKILPGNNGKVEVTVLDADGNPVEFAETSLIYSDGFPTGLPPQETGADGKIVFEGVPLVSLKALVTKGALKGSSDIIAVVVGDNSLTARLERGFGKIKVRARDASEKKPVFVPVVVTAFVNDNAIGSCTTISTSDGFCELQAWANTPVILKTKAAGFVDSESDEVTVDIGASKEKTLFVLPTYLSDQLKILDFHLENAETGDANVTDVSKGGVFKVVVSANIPQADRGGIFLKLGDKVDAASEKAFLFSFDKPSGVKVTWGTSFDEEKTCSALATKQQADELKWINFDYSSTGVVKTLSTFVKIRPQATKLDKIIFYYRAYAVKNALWARDPEDAALTNVESTLDKESCFADSFSKSFSVIEGSGLCNDKACLNVQLVTGDLSASNGLKVPLGNAFSVNAFVTTFVDAVNPVVKVTSLAKGNVIDFDGSASASAQLQFNLRKAQARIDGNTLLPTTSTSIRIEYADDSGTIVSMDRFIAIDGTGKMVLVASPTELETNVRKDVTVTLKDERGNAITNARVEIADSVGSPFGGSLNGPLYLLGDNSFGNGEGGVYKFRALNPTSIGTASVTAKLAGFQDGVGQLTVSAVDFFQVDPQELVLKCDSGSFSLSSALDVDVPVAVSLDGNCVSLPTAALTLTRTKPTATLRVKPNANGECRIAFNSVLPASGGVTQSEAVITVSCPALNPVIPGACSDENATTCGNCNEQQCTQIQTQGFSCKPLFVNSPDGPAFQKCEKTTPTVSVPPAVCAPENCGACDQAKCTALGLQDNSCTWKNNVCVPGSKPSTCSANNCGACSENQCINLAKTEACHLFNEDPKHPTPRLVSVNDIGGLKLEPAKLFASKGNAIAFTNDGIDDHIIYVKDLSRYLHLSAGDSQSVTFSATGSYEYCVVSDEKTKTCDGAPARAEIQIVSSTTNNNFLYCAQGKGEEQNKTDNFNNSQCVDPSKFDFGALFARRLALTQSNQLLSPNAASRAIASSASNQLVLTPNGWQSVLQGNGCTVSSNSLNCVKVVNALAPRNGIAVSVKNQLGSDTQLLTNIQGSSSCFTLQANVEERNSFDKFVSGVQQGVAGTLGLPQDQYKTFVAYFDATKPGCADWVYTQGDGVSLNIHGDKNKAAFVIKSSGLITTQFVINLEINFDDNDKAKKLAFIMSPMTPVVRGSPIQEPFFFANNINKAGSTITISQPSPSPAPASVVLNSMQTTTYASFDPTQELSITFPGSDAQKISGTPKIGDDQLFDKIGYDVIGNIETDSENPDCSSRNYCTPAQLETFKAIKQKELNDAVSNVYGGMDQVKFGGFVQASKDALAKAFDDARREYLALQQTALLCKQLGVDPIQKLQENCAKIQNTPQNFQDGSFSSVYGDVFRQASCDSEFANSAFALYGGNFNWDSYKARLMASSTPRDGIVDYGKPILVDEQAVINIPTRVAGSKGGLFYLQFKANPLAFTSYTDPVYGGDSQIDSTGLVPFGGSISGGYGLPLPLFNAKSGTKPGTSVTSSGGGSFFYVQPTSTFTNDQKTEVVESGVSPTLFTLNKFSVKAADVGDKDTEKILVDFANDGLDVSSLSKDAIKIAFYTDATQLTLPPKVSDALHTSTPPAGFIWLDSGTKTLNVLAPTLDSGVTGIAKEVVKYLLREEYAVTLSKLSKDCVITSAGVKEDILLTISPSCAETPATTSTSTSVEPLPELKTAEMQCEIYTPTSDSLIETVDDGSGLAPCDNGNSGFNPIKVDSTAYCLYFHLSLKTLKPDQIVEKDQVFNDVGFSFSYDVHQLQAGRTALANSKTVFDFYKTVTDYHTYDVSVNQFDSKMVSDAISSKNNIACVVKIVNNQNISPKKLPIAFFMYIGGSGLVGSKEVVGAGLPRKCLLGKYVPNSGWTQLNYFLDSGAIRTTAAGVPVLGGCNDFLN